MKQELLKTILMLAAGFWLWSYLRNEEPKFVPANQWDHPVQPIPVADLADASQRTALASFQEDIPTRTPNVADDPEASALLQSIGKRLKDSLPFRCQVEIVQHWHDERFLISGQYAQLGQGSNQSKLELQLTAADQSQPTAKISKICDGRFLYTHSVQGSFQTLEFVDLHRLQQTRLNSGMNEPQNPVGWIAAGGLASLFENLSEAFQFESIVSSESNGVAVCQLRGRWRDQKLIELLHHLVEPKMLQPVIRWNRLPDQLPHHVLLELENVPRFGWMPRRIIFSRSTGGDLHDLSRPLAEISISSPQPLGEDTNNFIHLQNDEVEAVDATDNYVTQIKQFGVTRRAAIESDATLHR